MENLIIADDYEKTKKKRNCFISKLIGFGARLLVILFISARPDFVILSKKGKDFVREPSKNEDFF